MTPIPPKLYQALNSHITSERYAHAVYSQMANALDDLSWEGMTKWTRKQAGDEAEHARMFEEYISDRNISKKQPAMLQPVAAPTLPNSNTPLGWFAFALMLEQQVTAQINDLYAQAQEMDDPATVVFLQWFVKEQQDSEKEISIIVDNLQRATDNATLLLMDERLGEA